MLSTFQKINDKKNCFFPNEIFHPALKELKALFFPDYDHPGIFSAFWEKGLGPFLIAKFSSVKSELGRKEYKKRNLNLANKLT